MNNWWQIAFSGACLVALGTLALGLWLGIRIGQDKAADAETAARFDAVPAPGRHRVAVPRQLPAAERPVDYWPAYLPHAASGSTAVLFARLEAEAAAPTAAMQPPLAALVGQAREHRPGPVTDAIRRWEADTDRFIAQMGDER